MDSGFDSFQYCHFRPALTQIDRPELPSGIKNLDKNHTVTYQPNKEPWAQFQKVHFFLIAVPNI
jgi:hypothetical protein